MTDFCEIYGQEILPEELKIPKAIGFYKSINANPFCTLIKIKQNDSLDEIIILDVEVERGQKIVYDIHYTERIAVKFTKVDDNFPAVYTLRKSFPLVPHLNLTEFEYPKLLCLYTVPFTELRAKWTAPQFLARIRKWFSLTASNKLHQENQPLEPFLIHTFGSIILPNDVLEKDHLSLFLVHKHKNRYIFRANDEHVDSSNSMFKLLKWSGEPQVHGIIKHAPQNLSELSDFLTNAGLHLKDLLKNEILNVNIALEANHRLIILLFLPKKRYREDTEPSASDFYAFITNNTIKEFGVETGLLYEVDGNVGQALSPSIGNLENCKISILNPHIDISRKKARSYNGLVERKYEGKTIMQIGCGALGSHVFHDALRQGVGEEWILIDKDILLPHNLARHILFDPHVGLYKTEGLASFGKHIFENNVKIETINEDFLSSFQTSKIQKALQESNLVLDFSASSAVLKKLGDNIERRGRVISAFFSPNGSNLVVLDEGDGKSNIRDLEAQYYRSLIRESELSGHLRLNQALRYSNSCTDISSVISLNDVITLSSTTTSYLIKNIHRNEPFIGIWIRNPENFELKYKNIKFYPKATYNSCNWIIHIDFFLINKIIKARKEKLPNETGGILIGFHDFDKQEIYLLDTLLSPIDSKEYPTSYVRGISGVKQYLNKVEELSAGNLYYIGEWHSHPDNYPVSASKDDKVLLRWLKAEMDQLGYPPLMLIAGENDQINILTSID